MFLCRVSQFVGILSNSKHITQFPLTRVRILQNVRSDYSSETNHPRFKGQQKSKPKVLWMENMTMKETVHVYSDKKSSERFYRWLPPFGLFQGIVCLGIGIWSLISKISDDDIVKLREESEFLEWLSIRQQKYQMVVVFIYLMTAVCCVTVCSLYPSRIIKNMWLLKGGNHITVETFSRFRIHRFLTVPLNEVSGKIMRKEFTHTVPLKFKDRFAMYVLHLDKGVLHRPDLFDYLIALKREFPKTGK